MLENQIRTLLEAGNPENGFLKYYTLDFSGQHVLENRKYQDEILNTIHSSKISFIATARQMGKTTLLNKYIEWFSSLHANSNCLIVSSTSGRNLFNINPLVPIELKKSNVYRLVNQSSISVISESNFKYIMGNRMHWDIISIDEPLDDRCFYEILNRCTFSKIVVAGGSTQGFTNIYNQFSNATRLKYPWDSIQREVTYLPTIRSFMTDRVFNEEMELGKLI